MNNTPNRSASPDREAQNAHQITASLKAYVDGELSPVQRWWVELHIGQCVACQTEVAMLRHLATTLKTVKDSAPNGLPQSASVPRAQLRTRILANLPDSAPLQVARIRRSVGAQTNPWSMRLPALAAGSLGALLLVVAGAYAHNHSTSGQHPDSATIATTVRSETAPKDSVPTESKNIASSITPKITSKMTTGSQEQPKIDPFAVTDLRDARSGSGQGSKPDSATGNDYTDPISREADRLMSERIQAKSQIAKTTNTRPNRTAAKQNTPNAEADRPLVLAVADISAALRQIQELTTTTGASVALYSQNAATPTEASPIVSSGVSSRISSRTSSGISSSTSTGGSAISGTGATVLKINVPVEHLSAFTTRLSQLGTPLVSSSKGTTASTSATNISRPQVPIAKKLDLKNPFYERLLPHAVPITSDHPNREQTTSNIAIAPTMVTFYLRLQK